MNRRDFIKNSTLASICMGLSNPIFAKIPTQNSDASAKTMIQIWLWGGPPHLDTFDPKPEAGFEYCGNLNSPIQTNVSGIKISQLLPELAKRADEYSLLRGMTHYSGAHVTASYLMQTGHLPGRFVFPSMGAVISKFKAHDVGYNAILPPYIILTKPQGRFSESGFLGVKHKPFFTGGDPGEPVFAVEGIVSKKISALEQAQRRALLKELNTFKNILSNNNKAQNVESSEEKAYDLILGDAGRVFDLSTESPELRAKYGNSTFGQSCLAARKLVEAGVLYITINYKGWDLHKSAAQELNVKSKELDKGLSTLLEDLNSRGLLDSTIVTCGG